MKKENISNKSTMVMAIVLFGLILTGYLLTRDKNKELSEFGILTEGTIISIDHRLSRGDFATYEYYVNGKRFTENQSAEGKVKIGDSFKVLYSKKNPKKSRILFDSPIKDKL